jgi:hypothetical protein
MFITYNPKFGDYKECECGHDYHRHFDGYDNNEAVGCKYCICFNVKLFNMMNEKIKTLGGVAEAAHEKRTKTPTTFVTVVYA